MKAVLTIYALKTFGSRQSLIVSFDGSYIIISFFCCSGCVMFNIFFFLSVSGKANNTQVHKLNGVLLSSELVMYAYAHLLTWTDIAIKLLDQGNEDISTQIHLWREILRHRGFYSMTSTLSLQVHFYTNVFIALV